MQNDLKTYRVEGMHCASCASIIGKTLEKLPGVKTATVNFATEKVAIDHDVSKVDVVTMNEAIGKLGYAIVAEESPLATGQVDQKDVSVEPGSGRLQREQTKTDFVVPLAFFVFGIMLWEILARSIASVPNFPLPMDLTELMLLMFATIVMFWIGHPFIVGVLRFFRYGIANMDTLVGIGTLSAYFYSAVIVLFPGVQTYYNLPDYTYFDVVIVVIGFVTLGKYLEARSKERTGEAIKKLIGLQAKTALVRRDGKEIEVPLSQVIVGDHIIVKPGAKIPVDGTIVRGSTTIDESMLSGESIPVDKSVGDMVIGATLNKQGSIEYEATRVGEDTVLADIIRLVERAQGSRAPIQALADRVSGVFVPVVLVIAFVTLLLWLFVAPQFIGQSAAISYGILSFVGVLVIACPCALGLATPTAIIVGVGKGAERGILVKDAEALERLAKVNTIVMDKTGTITKGTPEVTNVVTRGASTEEDIVRFAAAVERYSEHPLGVAIASYGMREDVALPEATQFIAQMGVGVEAVVEGKQVRVAKPIEDVRDDVVRQLEAEGKTVVCVYVANELAGFIALADTLKPGASEAVKRLHARGIEVIMLSGDNVRVATHIAREAGIKTVLAEVLPGEKAVKIESLKSAGRIVAMVGDGVNDAPALMAAHVGIAMATGADVAIESAGVTLLKGDITKVADAIELSKRTMRTVKQNLFWAFIYNVIGIPVAAGALYPLWGIILNPIFAGLAMAFSSVSVVMNALRLKVVK